MRMKEDCIYFTEDFRFQYTSRFFHAKLEKAKMTQSITRVARCIDNDLIEGFWGILKRERYYGKDLQSEKR